MRICDRMLALAGSAMLAGFLTSGPAPAQSIGAAPLVQVQVQVQLRASKPLTAQQLRDLEAKADQWNMKARLPPQITHALGVTSGSQVLTVRQLGRKTSTGYALALNRLPDSADMIVIARAGDGPINALLLAGDFSVKKAAVVQDGKSATDIPEKDAQDLLDAILAFYAQLAATFAAAK
jgi:hypothetical protein